MEGAGATTARIAKMKIDDTRQICAQHSRVAAFERPWIQERSGLRHFCSRGRLNATVKSRWEYVSFDLVRWIALGPLVAPGSSFDMWSADHRTKIK
jgi:hypothetical protein